jgi:hypothetical protein
MRTFRSVGRFRITLERAGCLKAFQTAWGVEIVHEKASPRVCLLEWSGREESGLG